MTVESKKSHSWAYSLGKGQFARGRTACPYAPRTPSRVAWCDGWTDAWYETFKAMLDGRASAEEKRLLVRYRADMREQNNLFTTYAPEIGRI